MPKTRKRSSRRSTPVAYSVYIVELDRICLRVPCAFAPLYVGQTAHSPEERFEQHKAGGRLAAPKPHRFGVRLRYDLMTAHDLGIAHKVFVNRGHDPSVPYYGFTEIEDIGGLPAVVGL